MKKRNIIDFKRWSNKTNVGRKIEGDMLMEMINIRQNKIALKSLLMKNVKTDDKGRVLLTKDDEWRNETEWDKLYEETKK